MTFTDWEGWYLVNREISPGAMFVAENPPDPMLCCLNHWITAQWPKKIREVRLHPEVYACVDSRVFTESTGETILSLFIRNQRLCSPDFAVVMDAQNGLTDDDLTAFWIGGKVKRVDQLLRERKPE